MAAIAGQQQDLFELLVVDPRAAGATKGRMKLVARRVLGVARQQVARDQAGLADAVKKLIASLRLVVGTAGDPDETSGDDQQYGR